MNREVKIKDLGLTEYKKVDITFYKNQFRKMSQGSKAYRSFMYDLKSVYRKAHNKDKAAAFSDADKRSILAQFIKGITDPRVKTNLVNQTEKAISIDGSNGSDVVKHCEHLKSTFKEVYSDIDQHGIVTQKTLNIVETDIDRSTDTNTEINMLQERLERLESQFNTPRCYNCGRLGHIKSECRPNSKVRRNPSQSRDRNRSNSRGRSNDRDRYRDKSHDRGRSGDRRSYSRERNDYRGRSSSRHQQALNNLPSLAHHFAQPPFSPNYNPYFNPHITQVPNQNFNQTGYNNRFNNNTSRGNAYRGNNYRGNGYRNNGYQGHRNNNFHNNNYRNNNSNNYRQNNGNYGQRQNQNRHQQVTFNCNHFRACQSVAECNQTNNSMGN